MIVKIGEITYKFIDYDRGLPYKCENNHLIEFCDIDDSYNCDKCNKAYHIIKPYFTTN